MILYTIYVACDVYLWHLRCLSMALTTDGTCDITFLYNIYGDIYITLNIMFPVCKAHFIFLIRRMMDKLEYERVGEQNVLTMIKKI